MPLRTRSSFPPGGWQFFENATGWSAPLPGVDDFYATVEKIIAHRQANPRFNLSVDYDTVANTLDTFTCHRIHFNPTYCLTEDQGLKKKSPSERPKQVVMAAEPKTYGLRQSLAKVVQGVKRSATGSRIINDWFGAGGLPVPIEQANKRANVCVTCPLNNMDNDWFFGIPKSVAVAIHEQLKVKNQMTLKVDQEAKIGACDACGCHLPLAVHVPISHIVNQTRKSEWNDLPAYCWKVVESK